MIGKKAIAIFVAIGVGLLAGVGGIYLYWQGGALPSSTEQAAATGGSPAAAPEPPKPQVEAEPAPPAKLQAEATGAVRPDTEPTAVPSFDVVVIDPSGEGVIAGRAAPGWQVSVQSGGTKVATVTADAQGEWSAVLDKPLPAGDHSLSLKITSPDGTRAVSSQESVRVMVGDEVKKTAAPSETTSATSQTPATAPMEQTAKPVEQDAALALAEPEEAVRAVPAGTPQNSPPKPALVFKTVDYQDSGSGIGSVSVSGTGQPGATVKVYCDDQLLVIVRARADGSWSVVAEKKLGTGQHIFRAERIDAATGQATATAMVAMERLVPKPPEVVAAKETTPRPAAAAPGSPSASSVAALQSAQKEVYTIRRGDTLWAIAKRYLGSGLRYTAIFQDNREIINDPDLILPQQQVKVPTQ
jgi:nucleoid-associated protein YgaU